MLIPDENEKDLVEIPDNIKGNLEIKPVKWIDEVLALALTRQPVPTAQAETSPAPAPTAEEEKRGRRNGRTTETGRPRPLMNSGPRAAPWLRGNCVGSRENRLGDFRQ